VLVSANEIRLRDGYPAHLSRSGLVDWNALLGLMAAAAEQGKDPFAEAVRVQERLFTSKPVFLGVEESLKNPDTPCGLKTDAERARHVRKRVSEMLNSRGEWEPVPAFTEKPLREIFVTEDRRRLLAAKSDGAAEPARPSPVPLLRWGKGARRASEGELVIKGRENDCVDQGISPPPAVATPEVRSDSTLFTVLAVPAALEKVGHGNLVEVSEDQGVKLWAAPSRWPKC